MLLTTIRVNQGIIPWVNLMSWYLRLVAYMNLFWTRYLIYIWIYVPPSTLVKEWTGQGGLSIRQLRGNSGLFSKSLCKKFSHSGFLVHFLHSTIMWVAKLERDLWGSHFSVYVWSGNDLNNFLIARPPSSTLYFRLHNDSIVRSMKYSHWSDGHQLYHKQFKWSSSVLSS